MIASVLRERLAIARRNQERGVYMLLTMVFIIFVGGFSIAALWTISYVSGAHTTLYAAAQSASYAAVGEVSFPGSFPGNNGFNFDCGDGFDPQPLSGEPRCDGGPAFQAADALLVEQLQGEFGLHMGSNVVYADANGNPASGIAAYEIATSAGVARADAAAEANSLNSWNSPTEFGSSQPFYTSGVVVELQANVSYMHCSLPVICDPISIHVSVPAAQAQPALPVTPPVWKKP